jgi:hypothetical protein
VHRRCCISPALTGWFLLLHTDSVASQDVCLLLLSPLLLRRHYRGLTSWAPHAKWDGVGWSEVPDLYRGGFVFGDLKSASMIIGKVNFGDFLSKLHTMLRFATCVYCFCCVNMDKVLEMTLCICYRDIAPMFLICWMS